jgi:hypothetical protein
LDTLKLKVASDAIIILSNQNPAAP